MDEAKGLKVLIVDDCADAAEALEFLLKLDGAQVQIEPSAQNILEVVRRFEPDLVLMDISLPGMDGFEACRLIRTEIAYQGYVAALTGWGRHEDVMAAKSAGFDVLVVKPVNIVELEKLLMAAAERRSH